MTRRDPHFSVVVPCYGHAKYLPALFDSLWAQTFRDFEVIAVDDGSPDDSRNVLEALKQTSPIPMRIVSTRNQGAHAALNLGAQLAEGAFLAFANDDDAYLPDRLDVFGRATRLLNEFEWGFSAVEPMDENGEAIEMNEIPDLTRRMAIQLSQIPLEAQGALTRRNAAISSGNLVVRTSSFRRLGGFANLRFTHDWELTLRLLAESAPYIAERPLYRYRVHTENAFAQQKNAEGAREADAESAAIIRLQRQRELAIRTFEPQIRPALEVDPDEAFAIKTTLWLVAKLRSIPVLYTFARTVARRARNLRRR